jgi:hypothetical protein
MIEVFLKQPVARERSIYACKDYEQCMICVTEDVDEGTIWLSLPELDRFIEGLQEIREHIKK